MHIDILPQYLFKKIALIALSDINLEPIKEAFVKHAPIDNFALNSMDGTVEKILWVISQDDPLISMVWEKADYIYLILPDTLTTLPQELLANIHNRPCDLVLMHSHSGPYKNTQKYYNQYTFKRHHHLSPVLDAYQRLYRYMTGQAIGLVISAGGFRGYAHYGLVKALFEKKIPIDCIGGSSMGAGIGAILARDFTWEHFDESFHDAMKQLSSERPRKNLTLPIVSLLSGYVVTKVVKNLFDQYQIEDLPINFFCVTGNLTNHEKDVKTHGELWEWLRASVAIPGILPPFEKDGMVYVDGGVCTNLPVVDMRDYLDSAGTIITFDIRIPPFHKDHFYHFPPVLSFKDLLLQKLHLTKKRYVMPALMDIVMESTFINQYMYDNQGARHAEIIVAPDTSGLSFRDSLKNESLILLAHELAKEKFLEKEALYKRWVL